MPLGSAHVTTGYQFLAQPAAAAAAPLPQVRLNFLSTLLPEAYSHLHQHLCASVLGCRLLLLPFQRDAPMDVKVARAMRAAVEHCQRVRWPRDLRPARADGVMVVQAISQSGPRQQLWCMIQALRLCASSKCMDALSFLSYPLSRANIVTECFQSKLLGLR